MENKQEINKTNNIEVLKKDVLQNSIEVKGLVKKFKSGYGIEDINFIVKPGTVFGYLGPNGAGKSTTIRSLMGFIKPDKGNSTIKNLKEKSIEDIVSYDSWKDKNQTQKIIGYVPGEIAFPENMTGINLLKMVFKLRGMSNWEDVKKYIYYWEFDPNLRIKKMSKGMKQKLALVIAWMHNPDIIILDEPTTGLDPLMQQKFVALVKQSKEEGKAIIMSSHIFSEIEKTCDIVSIIKKGQIVSTIDISKIRYNEEKTYEVKFKEKIKEDLLKSNLWKAEQLSHRSALVFIKNENINQFLEYVSKNQAEFLKEHPLDLEQYFMKYYENEISTVVKDNIEKYNEEPEKTSHVKASVEFINRSYKKMAILWTCLTILPIAMLSILIFTMYSKGTFEVLPNNIMKSEAAIKKQFSSILDMMFFGNLGFLLPVIFIIINSGSIVAGEVEKGTMVNFLTTNLTRKSVILTKMFTFISYIGLAVFLDLIITLALIYGLNIQQFVDISNLTTKFIGLFLLLFVISAIGFISSCYFNRMSYALVLVGAIVIISWVLTIAAKADASLDWMKYLSINTLFDYSSLDASKLSTFLGQYLFMALAGIGLFVGAYFVFTKKDLPL
ncbi:ABC transporter ATP-binding protein [Spiroplasma helicoides]|uniref:ABC transporter ATP-binding protein n=1 Tax=Spiroplasma helicoides TaxID=216938 RepID=A0A1B3SJI4_9MOLU|nr:ATP-binding cassette domain-containing protein [Spiroplasma helicoides]AOG60080.1 ABC transporter ATP-binding protein [Spiroplasma helicoides]